MPTVMINGAIRQYDKGTTFEAIVKEYQPKYNYSIALVYFNGKMRELSRRLERDGALSFITTADSSGHNAYPRSWARPARTHISRLNFRLGMPASAVLWAASGSHRIWRKDSRRGCA